MERLIAGLQCLMSVLLVCLFVVPFLLHCWASHIGDPRTCRTSIRSQLTRTCCGELGTNWKQRGICAMVPKCVFASIYVLLFQSMRRLLYCSTPRPPSHRQSLFLYYSTWGWGCTIDMPCLQVYAPTIRSGADFSRQLRESQFDTECLSERSALQGTVAV